jgi:hypothetical protein
MPVNKTKSPVVKKVIISECNDGPPPRRGWRGWDKQRSLPWQATVRKKQANLTCFFRTPNGTFFRTFYEGSGVDLEAKKYFSNGW